MKVDPRGLWAILRETAREWYDDDAPRLGASLAFYTLFSLAPMLVIVVAFLGLWVGEEAGRGELLRQLQGLVGRQGAEAIQTMIASAHRPGAGVLATVAGFVTLFVGATGVFVELQNALDRIWSVPPRRSGAVAQILRERALSFAMVLGVGFVLLVSLVLSAALSAVAGLLVGALHAALLQAANFVLSFFTITLLFALIFKMMPRTRLAWRDVWVGAAVTSLLFTIGKLLIGLYLGRSSVASSFGAAGSLVVVLLWVYFSSQILFFGAEFTQVWAHRRGSRCPEGGSPEPVPAPTPEEGRRGGAEVFG